MTDTKPLINYDQALALLNKVSEGKGEFVYKAPAQSDSCVNWTVIPGSNDYEYEPSCIIGHVLHELGFLNKVRVTEVVDAGVRMYPPGPVPSVWLNFTDKALSLMQAAQRNQDVGTPWGEAINDAQVWTVSSDRLDG